ncbi:hypothetical protein JIN85_14975 [Luteolibacter pohnpeiensis]|uniref:Glycosyl hydrolase family 67 n=1 Tax=Luteolibacter pohnpeiensis TaxID=454153 RepID=A0A934SD72_9BACT|nr:hypothetical protein [Luteolibacter pohnpeiensis]MBK1883719.1 hypothetical protein [Luteolibacter pohnpeiensis]
MELFLIDAIGPFFRGYDKQRINWSKIPFQHLKTTEPGRREQWDQIAEDLRSVAGQVKAIGYNAVTLDDLAHLARHPAHEPEVAQRIEVFRDEFSRLFNILRDEFGLKIFLTSDVIPSTPAVDAIIGDDSGVLSTYYRQLVSQTLDDFPQLSGLILRIGESDGNDVRDPIRTRLHLRGPAETNRFLKDILTEFDQRGRTLILRTWTVGAHKIGDLIWHRRTLASTLAGIDSPNFVVSMKHGESDFFRYLPLNRAFFRISQPKILELQARREYEGAGEYPSFIGRDCERFQRELATADNVVGMSVWCQTGGWHRFKRLTFLESNHRDIWVRLSVLAAIGIFKNGQTVEQVIGTHFPEKSTAILELLRDADTVVQEILYIEEFARMKLFFRRVRIPPLLHVYWDSLFINHAVRKVLRHFIRDPERVLRGGEAAALLFPPMIDNARKAGLPVDDIEHMRDLFGLILLARRYYLMPYDEELGKEIRAAKKTYKQRWPRKIRQRYRIKISFEPIRLTSRSLRIAAAVLLRRKRGYRLIDHLFTLNLLGVAYRIFRPRDKRAMPKFLRKSAMGVDALFK